MRVDPIAMQRRQRSAKITVPLRLQYRVCPIDPGDYNISIKHAGPDSEVSDILVVSYSALDLTLSIAFAGRQRCDA